MPIVEDGARIYSPEFVQCERLMHVNSDEVKDIMKCLDYSMEHCNKRYGVYQGLVYRGGLVSPFLILKFILFSKIMLRFRLKPRQHLNLSKDRKRIKTSQVVGSFCWAGMPNLPACSNNRRLGFLPQH